MKQIIFDTNVILSAFLWGGIPRSELSLALETGITLLITSETKREFAQTLNKSKFDEQLRFINGTRAEIIEAYQSIATEVTGASISQDAVTDPKDLIILAAAVGGPADVIVSGDKHLLTLKIYRNFPILTPADFLLILNPPAEPPATSSPEDEI